MVVDYYVDDDVDCVEDGEWCCWDFKGVYFYVYECFLLYKYGRYLGVYGGEGNFICLNW